MCATGGAIGSIQEVMVAYSEICSKLGGKIGNWRTFTDMRMYSIAYSGDHCKYII